MLPDAGQNLDLPVGHLGEVDEIALPLVAGRKDLVGKYWGNVS
jgi:hypothetical protein